MVNTMLQLKILAWITDLFSPGSGAQIAQAVGMSPGSCTALMSHRMSFCSVFQHIKQPAGLAPELAS